MPSVISEKFCGQTISQDQFEEIASIIAMFPKLSRAELANTICELFSWKRPTGKLKSIECRQFLERLDAKGLIQLPANRSTHKPRTKNAIDRTSKTKSQPVISMKVKELRPLKLHKVEAHDERQLWYEYVDRYHYLGYKIPFGAQLRYFIQSESNHTRLGCLQFSSPAWQMSPRDRWIGWTGEQRKRNLQLIVNNSRFLIFPWMEVKNLASAVLSLAAKTIPEDWFDAFGYRPVLMETLVDKKRFSGTCYRAANWIHVGETTGRGRMDRENKRHGKAVKDIYLYPLVKNYRQTLRQSIRPV